MGACLKEIRSERAEEFLEKLNTLCREFRDDAKENEDYGSALLVAGRVDGYPFVLAAGEAFAIAGAAQLASFAAHDALGDNGGPGRFGDDDTLPKNKQGWGKLL